MSKYLWLLDNGHGGVIAGVPQTPGKRGPSKEGYRELYEGEFNRAIVNRIIEYLESAGIDYVNITPQLHDISLYERLTRINSWAQHRKCILISVHANHSGGSGTASGVEVFTTKGRTASDEVAQVFMKKWNDYNIFDIPEDNIKVKLRTDLEDGDFDKEENFKILTGSKCPAILGETFFMDNLTDLTHWLYSPSGRDSIADRYIKTILEIEENGLKDY